MASKVNAELLFDKEDVKNVITNLSSVKVRSMKGKSALHDAIDVLMEIVSGMENCEYVAVERR